MFLIINFTSSFIKGKKKPRCVCEEFEFLKVFGRFGKESEDGMNMGSAGNYFYYYFDWGKGDAGIESGTQDAPLVGPLPLGWAFGCSVGNYWRI